MTGQLPQLLSTHYSLSAATIQPLAGEVDLNFRVLAEDGEQYTLKISRPHGNRRQADFEAAVMEHLAGKSLPFATPVSVGPVVELAEGRLMRLQSWVPGRMLDDVNPITAELRQQWGAVAGQLSAALADFTHPDAPTDYKWNPSQTLDCRPLGRYFFNAQRDLANYFWDRFENYALPVLASLPRQVIYADAHEHNLLVDEAGICGVIDFGDVIYSHAANELAIACAYAGMHVVDPLRAMAEVIAGYARHLPHGQTPILLELITARLLITVASAAENAQREPDNAYLQVSAAPAWALLEKLRDIPPALAKAKLLHAAGAPVHPNRERYDEWVAAQNFHPVVNLRGAVTTAFDLSVGSLDLGNYTNFNDPERFSRRVRRMLEDKDADFGVGGYGEVRPVYTTDDFMAEGNDGPRWRTTHLGLDVWGPAGTPVYAPCDGVMHSTGVDPTAGGYGNVIILEHRMAGGRPFYTLYGHLMPDNGTMRAGTPVRSGDEIARFGHVEVNGGWPPHLHFQVMVDLLGYEGDFPGVAFPEEADVWLGLCPDPAPFLPTFSSEKPATTPPFKQLSARRKQRLGYGLSVSYQRPLHIVRGGGQYLYDITGRRYLDTVNNVAHVGHEHPTVVRAIQRQAAVLNTNSRYLHDGIVAFAEELTATLPEELSVVHFVNSGSEANELALRMCEAWSGTRNMLALEVGYHGNTGRTIDVSSYKFDGKGGNGAPPRTTILPMPDVYRGLHRNPATAGADYAAYANQAIAAAEDRGKRYGGFIAESILSCGGQVVLPAGYLREVYAAVRAHGGLCVADEVQTGVGRVGKHWWAFELQGVVPDIVTIGKPLGNGHPLGAVVCTPAVAEAFANGMEYFNTFGGNPVSCAAGRAVLRTVREEGLMAHAREVGDYLQTSLRQLQSLHPVIGDVRGEGLFLGFELSYPDRASNGTTGPMPAAATAKYVKERMRQLGFLMSTDGTAENVIKIKPPLCFGRENADLLVDYLSRVLKEDGAR